MAPKTKLALSFIASAALVGAALAQPVAEGGRPFTTSLSGAEEIGPNGEVGVGDPDGRGTAKVTLNPGQQRVCWEITVANIATPTRGHIHEGLAGTNGPIRVAFFESGQPPILKGCTGDEPLPAFDRARVSDIIKNPQNYYVNVHNADFPAGAIRGQLSKKRD